MPVRFTENEQKLIGKLIKYFNRERNAGKPLLPDAAVHNRVADALEISIRSVEKIAAEGIQRDSDYKIKVHAGHISARGAPLYKVHEHTIRSRVYAMYSAGMQLSDSESDTDEETEHNIEDETSESHGPKSTISGLSFNQLQEYTKKIEEARKHVEMYKAKKQAQENKMDISNLLATGEGKSALGKTITPADLHSSDFESCDSEQEDWEEIKSQTQDAPDDNLVPAKSLQITVDMPDNVRKKKGVDLLAAMKRRLNRIRKENQVLVHKVHSLCWIAHGNYLNSAINNTETLAMALSLLPSDQSFPADRTDLSYLEQIVSWYKKTVKEVDKTVPKKKSLDLFLQNQINRKEACNKKMLAIIFVIILRALGIQARIVMSLQVEPLRPPASELHSLSTNDSSGKKHAASISKSKQPSNSNTPRMPGRNPLNDKATGNIKIKTQAPSPEENKKDSKNATTGKILATSQSQSRSKKNSPSQDNEKVPATELNKLESNTSTKKTRAKSAETTSSRKNTNNNKSSKIDKKRNVDDIGKSNLEIAKTKGRAKSAENLDSAAKNNSQKRIPQKSEGSTRFSANQSELIPNDSKTGKRIKSTESLEPVQSNSGRQRVKRSERVVQKSDNLASLSAGDSSTKKLTKGKESVELIQTGSSTSTWAKKSKGSDQQTESNLRVPNARKRTKSTGSKGSVTAFSNSSRSQSLEAVGSTKVTKTRSNKRISQVDGIYDSDSDSALTILQLDGANDQSQPKGKAKPNLKMLEKAPINQSTKKSKQPNLKSFATTKKISKKKMEQLDSESDFEPSSGTSFKQRLTKAAPGLSKLKNIKRQTRKQVDVTQDVVNLVKSRISEQKRIDRSRLAKKRKPAPDSESDSDYAPEPIKKKHHDSENDFLPKTKVKKRIQVHPVLPQNEVEKKKRKGNDVWVEVFLEAEEKWISVDVAFGQVHCVKEIYQRSTHPISYVLAWDNNNNVKDVTQRYCPNFNTVTRKLRINQKWWNESLKPFVGLPTAKDKEEDEDLARQQFDRPLPKVISEYKDHPLYVLRRHLLKFEALYPPEPTTLGFVRGEAVYPRTCVYTLHSRDIWLKQAKVVKLGEEPYKIVKARPRWDKLSNKIITDQLLEIFGPWQVQDYEPPTAENGIVPRNAFGNVDLFKPSMLPKGCVHLKLPGLNKITRRMNIDCASAIIGFDFHGGWTHPIYDGFVVCKEHEHQLICAWELEQDELDRKEQEKINKRVYVNWKKLIRGLLIRERLKAKYDFRGPTASTSKEKMKGLTFSTKRK